MLKSLFGLMGGLIFSCALFVADKEWTSRKYNRVWQVLDVLVIILALGFCASCRASVRYEPVPILLVDTLETMGKTVCDVKANKPVVLIRNNLTGFTASEVMYHEMVHARQALEYEGGCNALILKYQQDPEFAYAIEAEAYCESIQRLLPSREWSQARDILRLRLYNSMGRKLSKTEADEIVFRFCRSSPENTLPPDGLVIPP